MEPPARKGLLRKLAGVLLMFGMMTGTAEQGNGLMAGSGTQDQKGNAAASASSFMHKADAGAAAAKPAASGAVSEDARVAEKKHRELVNSGLVKMAREQFEQADPLKDAGYTRQLQAMEKDLNDYLRRNPSFNLHAVVLHPDEFDAARALGMGPQEAVKVMLNRQDLKPDAYMLAAIAKHMNFGYDSKFDLSGFTQDAETQPNVPSGTSPLKSYVIVPNSNHADPNPIPGFSYQDNIDFFNKHEGWHAKDSWYDMTKYSPQAQAATVEWNTDALANPEAREAFAMQMRKEALGDIGSIGDMLREDKTRTTAMIDTVAAWRRTDPFDVQHLSAPVLEGLKTEIDKMGIAAFRRLDEKHVKEFYHSVSEKYGMTAKAVQRALDYDCGDDAARLNITQQRDPDTQKAVAFMKMKNADPAPEDADIPLTAAQEEVKAALHKYNPSRELENRAMKLKGKVTPATFIEAYGQLEEELRQKALKEPNNPLYALQMTKLQETFIGMVPRADYVGINNRHKVNIEEAEPGLSRFTTPPPEAAPPAADTVQAAPKDATAPAVKKAIPKATTPG